MADAYALTVGALRLLSRLLAFVKNSSMSSPDPLPPFASFPPSFSPPLPLLPPLLLTVGGVFLAFCSPCSSTLSAPPTSLDRDAARLRNTTGWARPRARIPFSETSLMNRKQAAVAKQSHVRKRQVIRRVRTKTRNKRYQVPYITVQYSTVQYSTVQSGTVQYSTLQYTTAHYSTLQYSTVQYSTVQYSTVQYSTVQYRKAFSSKKQGCWPSLDVILGKGVLYIQFKIKASGCLIFLPIPAWLSSWSASWYSYQIYQ